MSRVVAALVALGAAFALPGAAPYAGAADVWGALAGGGHVLVVRHAETDPGLGDPPGFRLDECATQRNLSAAGRAQARAIGAGLAARNVAVGPVLASEWCRCVDTATLAFGRVERWSPLNSFFGDRAREAAQTEAVRRRVGAWKGPGTLVLVTHQVNITALTGEVPAMGEAVVLAPRGEAGFSVLGRVPF